MIIPSTEAIEKLHRKYAKSRFAFELVFTHSQIIAEIAGEIIRKKKLEVNAVFVNAAALLHDIGAYHFINEDDTISHEDYLLHGVIGATILQEEMVAEPFIRIALRHTGVGFTQEEVKAENLVLPPGDYMAETREEKLIMYADKFHSKQPCFNSYAFYESFVKHYGEVKLARFHTLANLFGIPHVQLLAKRYHMPLRGVVTS